LSLAGAHFKYTEEETDVILEDIQVWRADDVYEWLEAWGFEWDGTQWVGAEEGGEQ
jgi:hypothetical protein